MQKYYYELSIKPDTYYELYLELISELTDEAIEELDGQIIIRNEHPLETIKEGVETFTKELSIALDCDITTITNYEKKENEDWVSEYKNSIQPVEAGQFYIHPSWNESKEGKTNIVIDPALAFGSGHHETTSSCLELISKYVQEKNTLLDVGCGSGILSIAASKVGATVDICDTDPVSIENSTINFELNNCKFNNAWVGSAVSTKNKYDVVIANIVADVLIMIASDLKQSLNDNGVLILSGILSTYKDRVLKRFKQFEIIEIVTKGDWVTITLKQKDK